MLSWALMLVSALRASFAQEGPCPCVPAGACSSPPYGALPLDISVYGLYGPCSGIGSVRCCSRSGSEYLFGGGGTEDLLLAALTAQDSAARVKIKPVQRVNHAEKNPFSRNDCGCIKRGICPPHLTRHSDRCTGNRELCCISQHRQTLKELFSADRERDDGRLTRPQPVFRPDTKSRQQSQKEEVNDLDSQGLVCLEAANCNKIYGWDALDIANFGVLPPCSKPGFLRCVEPKPSTVAHEAGRNRPDPSPSRTARPTRPPPPPSARPIPRRPDATLLHRLGFPTEDLLSTTLQDLRAANPTVERGNLRLPEAVAAARALQLPDQSVRLVPCVQRTKCIGSVYDPNSVEHLSRFGVLPQCSGSMIRCIFELDLGIFSHQDNINLPVFTTDKERVNQQIFNERRFFEPENEEQDLHELEMHFVDYQDTDDSHQHQEHTHDHYTRKLQNILGRKVSAQKIHNAAPKTEELVGAFLHRHRFGQQQQQQQQRINDGFNHFTRQQEEETSRGGQPNFGFPEEPRPPLQQQPERLQEIREDIQHFDQIRRQLLHQIQRENQGDQRSSNTNRAALLEEMRQTAARILDADRAARDDDDDVTTAGQPAPAPQTTSPLQALQNIANGAQSKNFASEEHNRAKDIVVKEKLNNVAKQKERFGPPGSSVVKSASSASQRRQQSSAQTSQAEPQKAKPVEVRNFFTSKKRPNIFNRLRQLGEQRKAKVQKAKKKRVKLLKQKQEESEFKSQFKELERAASVVEDAAGNVVVSGGTKVFHLPPGISPPPGFGPPPPPPNPAHINPAPNQAASAKKPAASAPVFFDPAEAPDVVNALRNSKNAVIEVQTDDNKKMVLNVQNGQLLDILKALHLALNAVNSEK